MRKGSARAQASNRGTFLPALAALALKSAPLLPLRRRRPPRQPTSIFSPGAITAAREARAVGVLSPALVFGCHSAAGPSAAMRSSTRRAEIRFAILCPPAPHILLSKRVLRAAEQRSHRRRMQIKRGCQLVIAQSFAPQHEQLTLASPDRREHAAHSLLLLRGPHESLPASRCLSRARTPLSRSYRLRRVCRRKARPAPRMHRFGTVKLPALHSLPVRLRIFPKPQENLDGQLLGAPTRSRTTLAITLCDPRA